MKKKTITLILFLYTGFCFAGDPEHILFVGNSFTHFNNMPGMVQALAVANENVINIEKITKGGYSIVQHANDPKTLNAVASNKWDIIIFQGQSLEPIADQSNMIKGGKKLADQCAEARLMLYLTWAYQTERRFLQKAEKTKIGRLKHEEQINVYANMQKLLTEGYHAMAEEINAEVVPVGLAWQISRKRYPNLNLFREDEYHPSKQGSYLSAIVFYKAIFGKTPEKAALKFSDQAHHKNMTVLVDELK